MFDTPQNLSHRERDADYYGVIHTEGAWRVIVCKDGLQYIIQKRRTAAESMSPAHWGGRHFCTTRQSLMRLWERDVRGPTSMLAMLPDHAARFNLAEGKPPHETT